MSKQIFVGMSGGVDSSLSAALLVEQGYSVTGVFMKNWTRDLPGFKCAWEDDYKDAKAVAVQLGIPLMVFDFEKDYRGRVVEYMLEAYAQGLTPNPDIVCNQEIKFKLFLETAKQRGADMIATGHYARTHDGCLYKGVDPGKDQSYFLYRVSREALNSSLFPVGELTKPEVRRRAQALGLATADKPDSQGICFVGEVGIKQFLLHELGEQPYGDIIDQHNRVISQHDGAVFYTIGQRHGLNVGGGFPYYVTHKDMASNRVYVTTDLDDGRLWSDRITLVNPWWINQPPLPGHEYQVKTRYRADTTACRVDVRSDSALLCLNEPVRAVSPGQSAVIYDHDEVVGGGVIALAVRQGEKTATIGFSHEDSTRNTSDLSGILQT